LKGRVDSMMDSLAQSLTDVEEQENELSALRSDFAARTREVEELEAKWNANSEASAMLNDRVRELKETLGGSLTRSASTSPRSSPRSSPTLPKEDDANSKSSSKVSKTSSKSAASSFKKSSSRFAEITADDQRKELKKLEMSLQRENTQNLELKSQIDALKESIAQSQSQAQRTFDTQDDGLRKMVMELAHLSRKGTSTGKGRSSPTTASFSSSKRGETEKERKLRKKIELLAREFADAQKAYTETKIRVVESMSLHGDVETVLGRSMSLDPSEHCDTSTKGSSAATRFSQRKKAGWFEKLIDAVRNDTDTESYDNYSVISDGNTLTSYETSVVSDGDTYEKSVVTESTRDTRSIQQRSRWGKNTPEKGALAGALATFGMSDENTLTSFGTSVFSDGDTYKKSFSTKSTRGTKSTQRSQSGKNMPEKGALAGALATFMERASDSEESEDGYTYEESTMDGGTMATKSTMVSNVGNQKPVGEFGTELVSGMMNWLGTNVNSEGGEAKKEAA